MTSWTAHSIVCLLELDLMAFYAPYQGNKHNFEHANSNPRSLKSYFYVSSP